MTQHEVVRLANVEAAVILRSERGDKRPNLNTINRVAKGLDCEPFIVVKEKNDKMGGLD